MATLEKLMKEWLGGCNLFFDITPIVPGDRPLTAIEYNYNSWKLLLFIDTERYGSTDAGDCYKNTPNGYTSIFKLGVWVSTYR